MTPRHERLLAEKGDYRSPPQVDRDRILYSSSFSRLAEVTQVVSADRGYVFHNRLTHSLKVSQLARRIAQKLASEQKREAEELGGLDPDVAEAAGLAHDLGHPPFGHLAEDALNELCKCKGLPDGYEGNAQSFRIVTKLAVGDGLETSTKGPVMGLNLTRATLNGILKYPWMFGKNSVKPKKWGAYETEEKEFSWVRGSLGFSENVKSIEAELMDWADDITFSVHDLIDFYCAGQIPLHVLAATKDGEAERRAFFDEVFERRSDLVSRRKELENALTETLGYFPLDRHYIGSRDQRCKLWQFATVLISRYVEAIELAPKAMPARCVDIRAASEDEVLMLKELTWHYVILHNDLATDQHGRRKIVERVFKDLHAAAGDEKSWKLFPPFFKERLQLAGGDSRFVTRTVADYVASMTEQELTRNFQLLTGYH